MSDGGAAPARLVEAHVTRPPTVHVRAFAAGKRTLHATSDLTGHQTSLDLELTAQ